MTSDYVNELEKWVKKRDESTKKKRLDKNLVAFLSIKNDIETALNAGYSMSIIWENLKDKGTLTCRYETFRRYVKSHITENRGEKTKSKVSKKTSKIITAEPKGFKFNPVPNIDELI